MKRILALQLALVALVLSAAGSALAGLSGDQQAALARLIYKNGLNDCGDEGVYPLAEPPTAAPLNARCLGQPLFLLDLSTLRFKVGKGPPESCVGGYTGSGGTLTLILGWNSGTRQFAPLFADNLLGLAASPIASKADECPAFAAAVHHGYFEGFARNDHESVLEFDPAQRVYLVRIRNRRTGARVR